MDKGVYASDEGAVLNNVVGEKLIDRFFEKGDGFLAEICGHGGSE